MKGFSFLSVLAFFVTPILEGAVDPEPVLQDISPGWQSLKGERFTYINRGEFIDIYDNKSRVLYRSIRVSMDEGAGKGSACRFAVSADEKYVQATIWVKYIGDYLATYEVATGNPVEMAQITARESGGSADDFNNELLFLPPGIAPRSISRFATAPERFVDRTSFIASERAGARDLRQVHVSLLRCDGQDARPDESDSLRSAPSLSVDPQAEGGAADSFLSSDGDSGAHPTGSSRRGNRVGSALGGLDRCSLHGG